MYDKARREVPKDNFWFLPRATVDYLIHAVNGGRLWDLRPRKQALEGKINCQYAKHKASFFSKHFRCNCKHVSAQACPTHITFSAKYAATLKIHCHTADNIGSLYLFQYVLNLYVTGNTA